MSAEAKAIKVRLRGSVHHLLSGFVAAFFTLLVVVATFREGSEGLGFLVPLLPVVVGLLVVMAAWPPALVIGRDGVEVGPWWSRRFISAKEIAAVRPSETGISLELADEEVVVLPLVGSSERIPELCARIEGLIRRAVYAGAPLGQLSRGGRSLAEWRAALSEAVKPGGFRDARLTSRDCEAALADATLSGEQRIAAAIALSSSSAPDAADRIRVAGEASADPRVRIALQRLADGADDSDVAIEEALEAEAVIDR
jgi:hypothetical protein